MFKWFILSDVLLSPRRRGYGHQEVCVFIPLNVMPLVLGTMFNSLTGLMYSFLDLSIFAFIDIKFPVSHGFSLGPSRHLNYKA